MKILLSEEQFKRIVRLLQEDEEEIDDISLNNNNNNNNTEQTTQQVQTDGNVDLASMSHAAQINYLRKQSRLRARAKREERNKAAGQNNTQQTSSIETSNNNSNTTSNTGGGNEDWVKIVERVFDIFTTEGNSEYGTPLFKGKYSQANTIKDVNKLRSAGLRRSLKTRADCSGFVCTCLQEAGLIDPGKLSNTFGMEKWEIPGFTKVTLNGPVWSKAGGETTLNVNGQPTNPKAGDIFIRKGHITIYGGNGQCWDFGSSRKNTKGKPISGVGRVDASYGNYKIGFIYNGGGVPGAGASTNSSANTAQNGNGSASQVSVKVNGDGSNAMDKKSVCIGIFKAAKEVGCTDAAAMGICANAAAESGFKPYVLGWDGNGKTFGIGGGLFGFYYAGAMPTLMKFAYGSDGINKMEAINNKVRSSNLPSPRTACSSKNAAYIMDTLGIKFPVSYEQQLDYLKNIINTKYSGIKEKTDPRDAAMWWQKNYEKPAKITDRWATKGKLVQEYLS